MVPQKRLRVLVITAEGSERQKHIIDLFQHPAMAATFEAPVFSPGVSSRALNNRFKFLSVANDAGLIPKEEWDALKEAHESGRYAHCPENYFECLNEIPVTEGRRGSKADVKLHYSVEFWQKGKSLNRGRSVMACTFAHLIALKTFTTEDFDIMLEDNVRAPVESCAKLVHDGIEASRRLLEERKVECEFRFIGWLGSLTNLEYIFETHGRRRGFPDAAERDSTKSAGVIPFPMLSHVELDLPAIDDAEAKLSNTASNVDELDSVEQEKASTRRHSRPGGNFVWGCYAYWISEKAYKGLLATLRNDVGAMLWKGKRARYYSVKPIDKILPRQVMSLCGAESVQLLSSPAFFRAPMLTSKIHTKWDREFCKSTEFQLEKTQLVWSDLWLSEAETLVVKKRLADGQWLSLSELAEQQGTGSTDCKT